MATETSTNSVPYSTPNCRNSPLRPLRHNAEHLHRNLRVETVQICHDHFWTKCPQVVFPLSAAGVTTSSLCLLPTHCARHWRLYLKQRPPSMASGMPTWPTS